MRKYNASKTVWVDYSHISPAIELQTDLLGIFAFRWKEFLCSNLLQNHGFSILFDGTAEMFFDFIVVSIFYIILTVVCS